MPSFQNLDYYLTLAFITNEVCNKGRATVKEDVDFVFKHGDTLYPKGGTSPQNWIAIINRKLKRYQKNDGQLKSHSFIINYITQLLKQTSANVAQQMVGHQDIRYTMCYSRYILGPVQQQQILDDASKLENESKPDNPNNSEENTPF